MTENGSEDVQSDTGTHSDMDFPTDVDTTISEESTSVAQDSDSLVANTSTQCETSSISIDGEDEASIVQQIASTAQDDIVDDRGLKLYNYGQHGLLATILKETNYEKIMKEHENCFGRAEYDVFYAGTVDQNARQIDSTLSFYMVKSISQMRSCVNGMSGWEVGDICWARGGDGMFYPAEITHLNFDSVRIVFLYSDEIDFLYYDEELDVPYDEILKYDGEFFLLVTIGEEHYILQFGESATIVQVYEAIRYFSKTNEIQALILFPYNEAIVNDELKRYLTTGEMDDADREKIENAVQTFQRDVKGEKFIISVFEVYENRDHCVICKNKGMEGTSNFHTTDFCAYLYRCVHCNQYDHYERDCEQKLESKPCQRCFNFGHVAKDCTNSICCRYCENSGHMSANCPYWMCTPGDAKKKHPRGTHVAGIVLTPKQEILRQQAKENRKRHFIEQRKKYDHRNDR